MTVSAAGGYPDAPRMTIPSDGILIGTRVPHRRAGLHRPTRRAEAADALRAGVARVAVIARLVIYAAVWRSSRNCHHARAPSAAALVTCAGLAAVAASALAVQSAWSASRSACTSQNATPGPSMP